jgi:hypothetical protein
MRRLRWIAPIALIAAATAAQADVYRTVDAEGHVEYSDRWVPGAELVKTDRAHAADSSRSSTSDSQKRMTAENDRISAQLNREAAEREVKKDKDAARSEQCKQAKSRYQRAIESRRLYRDGANGERQYLTDDEADQERLQARLEVQEACGAAPANE